MKLQKGHFLGIGFALIIAVASAVFFWGQVIFFFLLSIAVVLGILPFVLGLVSRQGKQQEKEERFLSFARDLVETVRSGTPVSKSIINLKNRDYGPLSSHVEKLANQLAIGIPLTPAFETFAAETNSIVISRAVHLISEAERAGGRIETVLESVANSINQTETLRKERKASISNLVTQGYIIFMVFIVIMLVMEFKILPLVSGLSGGVQGLQAAPSITTATVDAVDFSMPLLVMLLVQSFFSGLVIGKISEGSVKKGIKHSFILLAITLLVVTGARSLFGAG